MTVKELEERVQALERQVKELQRQHSASQNGPHRDWRAAVEEFKNDEDLLSVFAEAIKLREQERRAVHKKRLTRRKPKS